MELSSYLSQLKQVNLSDATIVYLCGLAENSTFTQMFGNAKNVWEKLWVTEKVQQNFIKEYPQLLSKSGFTFFLRKKREDKPANLSNIYISRVSYEDGDVSVDKYEFSIGDLWRITSRNRIVVSSFYD